MKILVTGSEGNIGKKLVLYLKEKGHEVFRVDIKQGWGDDYKVADITKVGELERVFRDFKPEACFHLAAMVSRITCESSPYLTIDTNISGTNNIAQLCKEYDCKLVSFSTSEVYGNQEETMAEHIECHPNNIYGLSKYLAEEIVKYEVGNGLKAIIVRPFMIYDEEEDRGVHRSAMIRFAESLLKKETITIHKGSSRGWLHIKDAVVLFEKCIYINSFHIINIGHPNNISIYDLATRMCNIIGISPNTLIRVESLPKKMTLVKNPSLIKQEQLLDFYPKIDVNEGLKKVVENTKRRLLT